MYVAPNEKGPYFSIKLLINTDALHTHIRKPKTRLALRVKEIATMPETPPLPGYLMPPLGLIILMGAVE